MRSMVEGETLKSTAAPPNRAQAEPVEALSFLFWVNRKDGPSTSSGQTDFEIRRPPLIVILNLFQDPCRER